MQDGGMALSLEYLRKLRMLSEIQQRILYITNASADMPKRNVCQKMSQNKHKDGFV